MYIDNNFEILAENQSFISNKLSPAELTHAYLENYAANRIKIKIGNVYSSPIEVVGILENNVFDYRTVLPTLLNSYSRKYFLSCDGKFRVTLDDKQLFYNLYE